MQRDRDAQRAAERAQHELEAPAFNLLGQSNKLDGPLHRGRRRARATELYSPYDEYGGGI